MVGCNRGEEAERGGGGLLARLMTKFWVLKVEGRRWMNTAATVTFVILVGLSWGI